MVRSELKARAIALLARREHFRAELVRKLSRGQSELDEAQLQQVLDELERAGLLSEARAAEVFIAAKRGRFGEARLVAELKRRGASAETIAAHTTLLKEDELTRARSVWGRRFAAAPRSLEERARQARFLSARGFRTEVIRRLLGGKD